MSAELNLDAGPGYLPGEAITGTIRWSFPEPIAGAELRLFWLTEGKGSRDIEVAAVLPITGAGGISEQPFSLTAPLHPPSVDGQLVSIRWVLELVGLPQGHVPHVDIVIGPRRQPMRLGEPDET